LSSAAGVRDLLDDLLSGHEPSVLVSQEEETYNLSENVILGNNEIKKQQLCAIMRKPHNPFPVECESRNDFALQGV
jgi:hypothetical protein